MTIKQRILFTLILTNCLTIMIVEPLGVKIETMTDLLRVLLIINSVTVLNIVYHYRKNKLS